MNRAIQPAVFPNRLIIKAFDLISLFIENFPLDEKFPIVNFDSAEIDPIKHF